MIKNKYIKNYKFIILFVPGILFLLLTGNNFVYPPNSEYSDIVITHFPNVLYMKEAIINQNAFPFWSSTILSGYPFSSNPLSGVWYFPSYLCILFPQPFGINLITALHIIISTIGFYLFLTELKLNDDIALIGSVIWGLSPKIYAHYGLGHLSLIYAISWTPWLLFFEYRFFIDKRKKQFLYLTSAFYGMIILADPRWAAYSGLLWFAFSFWNELVNNQDLCKKHFNTRKNLFIILNWIKSFAYRLFISILLTLPLTISLFQYTKLSTRTNLSLNDNVNFSLPFKYLLGILFPNIGGYGEWVFYFGGLGLLGLIFFIGYLRKNKNIYFWYGTFFISIILSLGINIPGVKYIFELPILSLLRVPARFLFVAGFCIVIIISYFLERIFLGNGYKKYAKLILATILLLLLSLIFGIYLKYKIVQNEMIWSLLFLIYFFLVIWKISEEKNFYKVGIVLLFIGVFLDFGWISYSQVKIKDRDTVLSQSSNVVEYISADKDIFRIYSPSYSVPQHIGALNNFELADGIDPLQYSKYVTFMIEATGIPNEEYSVTLPPFMSGSPKSDNINFIPDNELLGLLNVKYIISHFSIDSTDLQLVDSNIFPYIYINKTYRPRAWIQNIDNVIGEEIISIPEINKYINKLEMTTDKKGLLVTSELNYPGWNIFIDDQKVDIYNKSSIFINTIIPDGIHKVVIKFKPDYIYSSLFLSFMTFIFVLYRIINYAQEK